MKKGFIILITLVTFIISVSCGNENNLPAVISDSEISLNEQNLNQLGIYDTTESSDSIEKVEYSVLNFEKQIGMWFTYMDYQSILKGKSEEEFTKSVISSFTNAKNLGVNTLFVSTRAFNDCYYNSKIFPKGEYYDGEYDPLEIVINEAHKLGLSVHAWVNPFRCQTDEQIKKIDDSFQIKKWYNDKEKNGTYIVRIEEKWYLNPAYPEVRDYVADGVKEIALNYDADGIHIDDYFYPTSDKEFDATAFSKSENTNLDQWRIDNINEVVSSIYNTVKSVNPDMLFGISPQGNIDLNYSSQYADVKTWISETGYCDYIVPQIYFGFKNENCPFKETVDKWINLNNCEDVKLVIGLCTYKIGNEDEWAGSGKNEWIEDSGIISQQVEYVAQNDLSFAIYSYASTFSNRITEEKETLLKTINKHYGGEQS